MVFCIVIIEGLDLGYEIEEEGRESEWERERRGGFGDIFIRRVENN